MSNNEIAQAFRDVYNGWWLRWRDAPLTDTNLDQAAKEAFNLGLDYQAEPLVVRMTQDLMRILERRKKEADNDERHIDQIHG